MNFFIKSVRILGMLVLVLATSLALYIPVQEYYSSETMDEQPVTKNSVHLKAMVVKHSQILSKIKATSHSLPLLFLLISAVLLKQTSKIRLPYLPIIPLRLRLLLLFPIKFTSKFV